MKISNSDFIAYVKRGEIPPNPPKSASSYGHFMPGLERGKKVDVKTFLEPYEARKECTKLGMWAIVDMTWTKTLAKWIGNRHVLEVMAGAGWLAKALRSYGVNIIPTDNKGRGYDTIVPVQRLRAITAIKKFSQAEVLLMSWPDYDTNDAFRAIKAWGPERPIIYIGEGYGGCTADDAFYEVFKPLKKQPKVSLLAWPGLHDSIQVGHYEKKEDKE